MRDKMRLAFIVQRYGPQISGGSEHHCRMFAERLAQRSDVEEVTVFSTCAKSYTTWENHYPAGNYEINGVQVERFPTRFSSAHSLRTLASMIQSRSRWR